MAKKGKSPFNVSDTPAMAEAMEEMYSDMQPMAPAPVTIGKKSARTSGKDWTLIQARVENSLHRRMNLFCAVNNVKKADVVSNALREYLDKMEGLH